MASIILAADTATTTEAVAVLRGDALLAERSAARGRGRGQALLELVHGALGDADTTIGQVDALVCGLGPGSFTGLRVVMATFKGLALALDRPLYGVPTAHAFAVAHPGRVVYAITDARRGEVFVDSAALEAPVSCKPAELGRWVPETGSPPLLLGNGAWAHRAALRAAVPHAELPEVEALHTPRVALLAVGLDRRTPAALAALEPLYVRRSDAELNYPDGFPTATAVPRQKSKLDAERR